MRISNRRLALIAVILWVAVAALFGYFMWIGWGFSALGNGEPSSSSSTSSTQRSGSSSSASSVTTVTTASAGQTTTLDVSAGGDVMGDRKVGTFVDNNGGAAVFSKVKSYFKDADLAFVNLESPLSSKGTDRKYKTFTFRGRPALVDGLTSAGIDVVSLANNHQLDWGSAALTDEISRLDAVGVAHAGAGSNKQAATAPAIIKTSAGTVAVLAYTQIISSSSATPDSPGTNGLSTNHQAVIDAVKSAKKTADYVIDAGADLVLGHHPHVIQGLEIYKDKLIAYSLGDFVFDHRTRATGEAFILQVKLAKTGRPQLTAIPVYLSDSSGIPAVVTGSAASSINQRLAKYSKGLGLNLVESGGRLTLPTA